MTKHAHFATHFYPGENYKHDPHDKKHVYECRCGIKYNSYDDLKWHLGEYGNGD